MAAQCTPIPVTAIYSALFLIGTPANLFISYCYHMVHPTWQRSPVQIKLFKLLAVSDIVTLVTAGVIAPISGAIFSQNPCVYFLFITCMCASFSQGVVCIIAASRCCSVIYPVAPERPCIQYTSLTAHTVLVTSGMTIGTINLNYNGLLMLFLCQFVSITLVLLTLLTSLATIICLVRCSLSSSGTLTVSTSTESGNNVSRSSSHGDKVGHDTSTPTYS